MTFREILETIVNETPGALAGAIMASDGIPVDEYVREPGQVDLSALAAEFQGVHDLSRKVAGALYAAEGGGLEELMLVVGGHQLLFRQVDQDFFVLIVLDRGGLLAKARYRVRALLRELQEAL